MSRLAVVNAGCVLSGMLEDPVLVGADTVVCDGGTIEAAGRREALAGLVEAAEVVLDAAGTTIAPGLIDSHCHVVLGDYTPRQKTVDFLDSYVHGGITSIVSPGEIHAPGRPHESVAVKALAIAARCCFANFRPTGMRVHAGAVILEPTLGPSDFAELRAAGVWLAKFGFGAYSDPADGVEQVRGAQAEGIKVMCHSGGASIPGSKPITPEHLVLLRPDVCGHANGGPTSLSPEGVEMLVRETDLVLQLVQAGNVRSAVAIVRLAAETGNLSRLVIGSDTPTGTGVMPLGVLKTVAEISSLAGLAPEQAWALATGNNARVWELRSGVIEPGADADLLVMDAPWGSAAPDALGALAIGDLPGISAVVIEGEVRTLTSRNTPQATRMAFVTPALPHLVAGRH
ncbi:MAG: amidohydrolase family protein [Acidimicrobiales bacterium]